MKNQAKIKDQNVGNQVVISYNENLAKYLNASFGNLEFESRDYTNLITSFNESFDLYITTDLTNGAQISIKYQASQYNYEVVFNSFLRVENFIKSINL